MAYSVTTVPAGTTSTPAQLLINQNLTAGPQVQGGSVLIQTGPSQNGPWFPAAGGSSLAAISVRAAVNLWYTVTASTQAATVAVMDMAIPGMQGVMLAANVPFDSANVTTETAVFTYRIPPNTLPLNFQMTLNGNLRMTNNANAKTMQVRMNGIAGTLAFQSPALASNANYNFEAAFSGAGDGATLKGFGAGATGGWGLSTTAYTSLSQTYIASETEIVISVTKATGTDTMALDSLDLKIA
jgi:hypothetical protein